MQDLKDILKLYNDKTNNMSEEIFNQRVLRLLFEIKTTLTRNPDAPFVEVTSDFYKELTHVYNLLLSHDIPVILDKKRTAKLALVVFLPKN